MGQEDNSTFEDETVVITGGAQGIGQACVVEFVSKGATVIAGDINDMSKTIKRCKSLPGELACLKTDVTNESDIETLINSAEDEGGIDVLVNNAGISKTKSLDDITNGDWNEVIDINLKGPFDVVKQARSSLREKEGAVVNIGSIFAQLGGQDRTGYCSSKAGVNGLTRALATELGPDGVRVNAVNPGFIKTPMTEPYLDETELIDKFKDRTALKRFGDPMEVAKTVSFLSSDKASFITGECILVDGGRAQTEPL